MIRLKLPKVIKATRELNYSVNKELLEIIAEINEVEVDEVTLEQLVEHISDWAIEDLASSEVTVVLRDENGVEIGSL